MMDEEDWTREEAAHNAHNAAFEEAERRVAKGLELDDSQENRRRLIRMEIDRDPGLAGDFAVVEALRDEFAGALDPVRADRIARNVMARLAEQQQGGARRTEAAPVMTYVVHLN